MQWLAQAPLDVATLIEFCKFAGAGGLAVGIPLWWFWHKDVREQRKSLQGELTAEREYIRNAVKETLEVLHELSQVIGKNEHGDTSRHTELIRRIDEAVRSIKEHFDSRRSG